jgi:hypothetical protein
MPLIDHFHPPIHPLRSWESFHSLWAGEILDRLNRVLPPRFFADVRVHLGAEVEADVAEFERERVMADLLNGGNGSVAVATTAPPAVTAVLEAIFPDDIEVRVIDTRDGAVLVAVVELVSRRNKDRPDARRAFAMKCAAYLQRGIGLIVVDIVTTRQADLSAELLGLLPQPQAPGLPPNSWLHAAAYRPIRRQEKNQIDVWARAGHRPALAQSASGPPRRRLRVCGPRRDLHRNPDAQPAVMAKPASSEAGG